MEGETVDITCTSSSGRPAPLLNFVVGNTVIDTNTNVSTTYDNSTELYKSVSKLHSFKREWGNKSMSCQQLPEVKGLYYGTESNNVFIDYKYPPSGLFIALIDQHILSVVHSANCIMTNSNPVCNIKWESSIDDFKYSLVQNSKISTIKFNVTDTDFGKQIGCSAECPDFENAPSNSTTVIFAKKPKVIIQPSSVLPVLPNTQLAFNCTANAFPFGNITWNLIKATNSSHEKLCLNASTCTYEITTSDIAQEYVCIAKNEHGTDRGSINVTVQEHTHNEELTGTGTLGVTLGITSGTTSFLLIGIVVILRLWQRRKQANLPLKIGDNQIEMDRLPSTTAADTDEVTHEGAEYAVINKTRRDPENVALPSSKGMPACKTKNECLNNIATESSVHVEQPSIENSVSAQEPGPSTQQDARIAADRDDVTHARMDGAEYAVIDKIQRDPEHVALPYSKDMSSSKTNDERLDNSATKSSVNVEQPSIENGKRAPEPGSLTKPDVSRCQSKADINTTEKGTDIVVSKQKQITIPEAANANSPKRATDELVYADVDIEHLEKSRAGNRACNNDEPTEYSDIVFGI